MVARTALLSALLATIVACLITAEAKPTTRVRRGYDDVLGNLESGEVVQPDGQPHEDGDDFVDQLMRDRETLAMEGKSHVDWDDRIEQAKSAFEEESQKPTTTPSEEEEERGEEEDEEEEEEEEEQEEVVLPQVVTPSRPQSRWPTITFPGPRATARPSVVRPSSTQRPSRPTTRRTTMHPRDTYDTQDADQAGWGGGGGGYAPSFPYGNNRNGYGGFGFGNGNGFGYGFGGQQQGIIGGLLSGIGRGIATTVQGVTGALANKWQAKAAAARAVAGSMLNTGQTAMRAGLDAGFAHPRFAFEAAGNVLG